ncbi:MAG TPA: hypothetical protein VKB80_32595 [Kofleriaceae bacterium]|nr:hypothetical protein [Kofleriaceae bacterium]
MHGKVVLVCSDRARTWRHVTPPLAGAANQLVHAPSSDRAAELLHSGAIDLALVEWPCGVDLDRVRDAAGGRVPLVVLVSETGIRSLEELICRRGILHLCAARPEQEASATRLVDPEELVVTCEKILRRDVFGLSKYLAGFGIERHCRVVERAGERDGLVGELTEAARALGGGRRVVESVSLVADELFTNAVYNAPRDGDGKPRYAHVNRREKIVLEPSEYVRVEFGSDGRTFGMAVTDSFGALVPSSLRGSIERCIARQDPIENKPGGAGIGLYAALCHADHLVFNLDPGRRTEVIALWSLARKTGGRGAGVASLHVFEAGEIAAGQGAATEPTVELSPAVKSEIFSALVDGSGGRVSLTEPMVRQPVFDTVRDVVLAAPEAVTLSEREQPATEEVQTVEEPAPPAEVRAGADGAADRPPALEVGADVEAADVGVEAEVDLDAEAGCVEVVASAEPARVEEAPPDRRPEADAAPGADDAPDHEVLPDDDEDDGRVTYGDPEPLLVTGHTMEVDPEMVLAAELEPVDSGSLTPVRDLGILLEVESGMLLPVDDDDLDDEPASDDAAVPDEIEQIEEIDLQNAIDMADLYEMATLMEVTGLLPHANPPWLGPLTCLRGVHIPRRSDGPGFEGALASLRASVTLADAIETLLGYLVGRWSAAVLLCRVGDALVPWSAAGDVDSWDELCEFEVPLADGWLSARTRAPGLTLASLDEDDSARRMTDLLTTQGADQGMAFSFALDRVVLTVFACRWRANAPGDSASDYEELQRELAELTGRIDRFSRLPTMRRQSSARAGGW